MQVDKVPTLSPPKTTFASWLLLDMLCCDSLLQTGGINPCLSLSTCILSLMLVDSLVPSYINQVQTPVQCCYGTVLYYLWPNSVLRLKHSWEGQTQNTNYSPMSWLLNMLRLILGKKCRYIPIPWFVCIDAVAQFFHKTFIYTQSVINCPISPK